MEDNRLRPHDRDAERSVLGSILRDNSVIDAVMAKIRGATFHSFAHRLIFDACVALIVKQRGVADPVTLCNYLYERGQTSEIGGNGYIVELWDAAPTSSNAIYYAEIVYACAIRRKLIKVAEDISTTAYAGGEWRDLVEEAEKAIFAVSAKTRASQIVDFSVAVNESLNRIIEKQDAREKGKEAEGLLLTGYQNLDSIIGCIDPGDVVIVAARPSSGKTAFMVNLAVSMSERGDGVFLVSLEQPRRELADRALAARGLVPASAIRKATVTVEESARLWDTVPFFDKLPLKIDDAPSQTALDIVSSMRRMKSLGYKVCMIDYLQLIDSEDARIPREQQVARISRALKVSGARKLGMPIILLAQVNRKSEDRADGRIKISDLRESGSVEQDADTILLLQTTDNPRELAVEVGKGRKSDKGTAMLEFDKPMLRMTDWVEPQKPQKENTLL